MKADTKNVTRLIKTAKGQLEGVLRMIEKDTYCMDVLNQILAAQAVLRRAEREIVSAHLQSCVTEAFTFGEEENRKEKIDELVALFDKLTK